MGARLDPLRHLDQPGHPPLHRLYPVPLRNQRGPLPGRDQAPDLLQKKKEQEASADDDLLRVDCCYGHHLSTDVWMVSRRTNFKTLDIILTLN